MRKKPQTNVLLPSDSFIIKFFASNEEGRKTAAYKRLNTLARQLNTIEHLITKVQRRYNFGDLVMLGKPAIIGVDYIELTFYETAKLSVENAARKLAVSKDLKREDERLNLKFLVFDKTGKPLFTSTYYISRFIRLEEDAYNDNISNGIKLNMVLEVQ